MKTAMRYASPTRASARRKAVLFCPGCGRSDELDGEWLVSVTSDRRRYECPACTTTVVSQPRL